MSIGATVPALSAPDDPDRTVMRSDDFRTEVSRQKLANIEATSIRLKLDLDAVPIEDRLADKATPTASLPAGFPTDGTLQFPDDMFSLGIFQDSPDTEEPPSGDSNLAAQATNPVAPLIQLQLQNSFVGESKAGKGYSNTFVVQTVIPWKIGEQAVISRITFPLLVGSADLGAPIGRQYGVGDLVFLNAFTSNVGIGSKWQGMMGPILSFTVPTASSDFLGEGKYQTGPGFIYINTASKSFQWGALLYQQWSFGSSGGDSGRPEVSRFYFQPILTKHFDKGWYISLGDILYSVDFNDNDRFSFPVGVRVGRVTKFGDQPVNIFVMPFYDFSGNNKGNEWGVKLNVTFLFPSSP